MTSRKPQSEAERELERMFGSEEEQKMSFIEQAKVSMINRTFTKSPVFFKMFFDKVYRRDRFDVIVNQIDNFQNTNEFRTKVLQNYQRFPLSSVRNISLLKMKLPEQEL